MRYRLVSRHPEAIASVAVQNQRSPDVASIVIRLYQRPSGL
jgi:hypothetical protein